MVLIKIGGCKNIFGMLHFEQMRKFTAGFIFIKKEIKKER